MKKVIVAFALILSAATAIAGGKEKKSEQATLDAMYYEVFVEDQEELAFWDLNDSKVEVLVYSTTGTLVIQEFAQHEYDLVSGSEALNTLLEDADLLMETSNTLHYVLKK